MNNAQFWICMKVGWTVIDNWSMDSLYLCMIYLIWIFLFEHDYEIELCYSLCILKYKLHIWDHHHKNHLLHIFQWIIYFETDRYQFNLECHHPTYPINQILCILLHSFNIIYCIICSYYSSVMYIMCLLMS